MNRRLVVLFVAYYVTLIAMLVASFYPESRVWGLNWWAFFSLWVRWSLFIIGGLAPLIFLIPSVRKSSGELKPVNQNRQYLIISTGTSVICALLFYLLRAKTHFLGDGYTLISSLGASRSFAIKFREIGESLAHVGLFSVLGSDGESTALLSYQIISCVAGILFVFLALFSARRLFDTLLDRLLFVFGLLSGGYLLLFFGYVENYSLFVLSLFSFVIAGLLIAEGKINRWWILALFGLSVFFHVMGVILLPATLYLLISGTSLGQIMTRMKRSTILLLSIIGATGAVAVFYHFYTSSYFFRFAFVPFIENRFTTNGYTMFSLDHILDFMNLLFLLIPGLLLLAVSIHKTEIIQQFKHRWFKFLSIAILSTLGAVFIFDPRLGMPRDWDLFAFAGVPIAVFTFYYLLKQKNKTNQMTTVLIVVLGMLILIPRVGSQIIPEKSLSLVKSYRLLDKDRCHI